MKINDRILFEDNHLIVVNKLPSEIQDILREGAVKFGQEHREAVASEEEKQIQELKDEADFRVQCNEA